LSLREYRLRRHTSRADAEAAVRAAVDRFGRIDVLVSNAASFYAGYFEELTPEQMERQLATSLVGPMTQPRGIKIDPSGKFLVASGEKSDRLSVYKINQTNGQLTLPRPPIRWAGRKLGRNRRSAVTSGSRFAKKKC
jgi:NAD(P)-dependent dehydrogenase (short-subunit alcohol dehydrogenase family)